MKNGQYREITYRDVIIVGNGPSGLLLSLMLSGRHPFLTSADHPDEMLAARLRPFIGRDLLELDLEELSRGLEGRSGNPVSLLADALLRPGADLGLEMDPLIEFRKTSQKVDHIVLGKGLPGGSWHRMDPQILTLSLGAWMRLPGSPFQPRDSGEKRAYAKNVAAYYERYTVDMGIAKSFRNGVTVTRVDSVGNLEETEQQRVKPRHIWVKQISNDLCNSLETCLQPEEKTSFISNAINCLTLKHRQKARYKRPREQLAQDNSPTRKIFNSDQQGKQRSLSEGSNYVCDKVPTFNPSNLPQNNLYQARWIIDAIESETGQKEKYACRHLILATGSYDQPNRLELSNEGSIEPDWLLYDLTNMEEKLDTYLVDKTAKDIEPVLVVGAGLSAADAIIAARGRNVPVIHVFRNKSPELNKQLPENLYPEYHKVHEMMQDGGSTYPLYSSYPEHTLTEFDERTRTVTLTSLDTGKQVELRVSLATVFIGSRPDLSFLSENIRTGRNKDSPLDCKSNILNINKVTNEVIGAEGLFAVGPLVGDNFVRFLPGGTMIVVAELCRRSRFS